MFSESRICQKYYKINLMIIIFQGFFSLWKGFTPYYFRLGPHTVLTFIFLEQMNKAYKLHVLGIQGGSGGL